jgi:predicted nucleic acid-binding protein
MPAYVDSSVVLSLLIGDAHARRAEELWHADLERVSSVLLEVECVTVLRRVAEPEQRRAVEQRLAAALEEVTLKPLDEDITSIVRDTTRLAGCRALDAAHLATALYFRAVDPALVVHTFDARMAEVARHLGLDVRDTTT